METRGRRSLRASGPNEAPVAPVKPPEPPVIESGPSEAEPLKPIELIAEAAKPMETAVDLVAAAAEAAPKPDVGPLPPVQETAAHDNRGDLGTGAASSLAQSQAALARGIEALSAEMAGLALSGMNIAARTATKLLAVKTLADAIEVNAGFACGSFDALVDGSAKLSELGMKLATDVSQPLFRQLGKGWSKAAQPGG
jgi:phasin protein